MNEKLLEKKLVSGVKDQGGIAIKLLSTLFTGLPDRMVLMPGGRVFFAEIKTTGKHTTPRQDIVHGMLRKLGFQVFTIDTQDKLDIFLTTIKS